MAGKPKLTDKQRNKIDRALSRRLRKARHKHKWSLEEAATATGLSRSQVGSFECEGSSARVPRWRQIIQLSRGYDIPVSELIPAEFRIL